MIQPDVPVTFPTVIDATIRRTWKQCQTRGYYAHFRNLAPVGLPSIHLHAGGCFAAGLRATRDHYYNGLGSPDEAIGVGIARLIRAWGDRPDPSDADGDSGSKKTLSRMVEALVAYFDHWNLATDHIKPHRLDSGKLMTEVSFCLPIPNTKHPETGEQLLYAGRYDMLAARNSVLLVEDDKTTSKLGSTWGNTWELRSQFTGYCWGAREFGLPVAGTLVRGISILKNEFGFAEILTYRPAWLIDKWLEQLQWDLLQMCESYYAGTWQQDLDEACMSYNRACDFMTLCATPNPEPLIPINYGTRIWDPLQHLDH